MVFGGRSLTPYRHRSADVHGTADLKETPSSCFVDISELYALMVEHGHLTAPYVKVIAHWEDPAVFN